MSAFGHALGAELRHLARDRWDLPQVGSIPADRSLIAIAVPSAVIVLLQLLGNLINLVLLPALPGPIIGMLLLFGLLLLRRSIPESLEKTAALLLQYLPLLLILLAHHHAAPTDGSPRSYLLRLAFGATTGLAFSIAVAPLIEYGIITPFFHTEDDDGFSMDAWHTTVALSVVWVVAAALLAVFEPRIARWLDRGR